MSASSLKVKGMHCKLKTHKFAFVDNVKGKLKRKVRMVFVVQENKMQHRWSNSLCQVTRGVCGEPVWCKYNISLCHSRFAKYTFTHILLYNYIILYYIIFYGFSCIFSTVLLQVVRTVRRNHSSMIS